MGYVVDTKLPQVLQEQKVVKISGHECFQKRNPSYYPLPAWLGYGDCVIGYKTNAGWIGVKSNLEFLNKF